MKNLHLPKYNRVVKAGFSQTKRIFVAVGLTGVVRAEWMFARYGQVIPCNWSQTEHQMWFPTYGPMGFLVAEARNMAVRQFLRLGYEWLLFIDHDTVLPLDFFLTANERIIRERIPVWSGLYFTKSIPAEPLVYRGQGTGYYPYWHMGDKVWVDSLPMGCTVIHRSILEAMWKESEEYAVGPQGQQEVLRRVFETPAKAWKEDGYWQTLSGTEDLNWSWKVIANGIFKKAGWPEYQRKKFPFMIDTALFCRHIDINGIQYPNAGEEHFFERKKKREANPRPT